MRKSIISNTSSKHSCGLSGKNHFQYFIKTQLWLIRQKSFPILHQNTAVAYQAKIISNTSSKHSCGLSGKNHFQYFIKTQLWLIRQKSFPILHQNTAVAYQAKIISNTSSKHSCGLSGKNKVYNQILFFYLHQPLPTVFIRRKKICWQISYLGY